MKFAIDNGLPRITIDGLLGIWDPKSQMQWSSSHKVNYDPIRTLPSCKEGRVHALGS